MLAEWESDSPQVAAIDTETEGVLWQHKLFCVTISWRAGNTVKNWYVEMRPHEEGYYPGGKDDVRRILLGTPILVFHNAKFDLQKLVMAGILTRKELDTLVFEDTEALYHLQDEHGRKGLKHLARTILGEETDEETVLKAVRRKLKLKKSDGYHLIPREYLEPYALKDTEYTLRLYEYLKPKLPEDVQYLYDLEGRLVLSVLDIEAAGMAIDMYYVKQQLVELGDKAMELHCEIQKYAGDLNPNSPIQLINYFASVGIETESVNVEALNEIDHPVARLVLELRGVNKTRVTYFKAIADESEDYGFFHVLHPSFRLHGTRTGRMSSGSAEQ